MHSRVTRMFQYDFTVLTRSLFNVLNPMQLSFPTGVFDASIVSEAKFRVILLSLPCRTLSKISIYQEIVVRSTERWGINLLLLGTTTSFLNGLA